MEKEGTASHDLYHKLEEKLIDSIVSRSYVIHEHIDDEEDSNNDSYLPSFESIDRDEFISDEEDIRILMEREVHFSGSFRTMLHYYSDDNRKGIHSDIFLSRIEELFDIEERIDRNIAPLILKGSDAEKVARAKKMYSEMQKIILTFYEKSEKNPDDLNLPAHIVLLESILSEESVEELAEKNKEVFRKIPSLLYPIIRSHDLYDHLFPGYGTAPLFAITLLGKIGDIGSIEILFDELDSYRNNESQEIDDAIVIALQKIGGSVRDKMLRLMQQRPLSRDNEKAVQVLLQFLPDEHISLSAMNELMKGDISSQEHLSYLVLLLCSLSQDKKKELQEWVHTHRKIFSYEVMTELQNVVHIS